MRHASRIMLVALAWPLIACDPTEPSDEQQYELDIDLIDRLGVDSRRVLVGTGFELYIERLAGEDSRHDAHECATSSASGSLTKAPYNRYLVDEAGPGAVEFAAPSDECPANAELANLGPDRWSMIGVEASAATGVWMPGTDSLALAHNTSPGPAGVFPDGFGRPLVDARVAAESRFALLPTIVESGAGERAEVRWSGGDLALHVPAHYEGLATFTDDEGVTRPQNQLDGSLRAGQSFDSSITILTHEFALPKVHAVPIEHIASLELVPVYNTTDTAPERDWGPPAGIVAITRDAEGQRIVGAPVEWSVTRGRIALSSEELGLGGDALPIGMCEQEPKQAQWRGATIEASVNGLVTVAELEWVALPSDATDPTHPDCTGSACDCSTTDDPRDSGLALLALFGLGAWLRRRPQTSRSSAASTLPR